MKNPFKINKLQAWVEGSDPSTATNLFHIMKRVVPLIIFLSIFFFSIYVVFVLFSPVSLETEEIEIHLQEGMIYREVLDMLSEKEMIRDTYLLYLFGIISGIDKRLKAGYYTFENGITTFGIFKRILRGVVNDLEITILPGSTLWDIAPIFEDRDIMDKGSFFYLAYNRDLLTSLNIHAPSLEGYIFPDTYRFKKRQSADIIVKRMVENLRRHYPDDFNIKAAKNGMSENQVLTMASIIEKEAKYDHERSMISAVYHNRLKKRIPLQADPTAVYGEKKGGGKISRRDLQNDNPYNTYRITGLPLGPIASPSLKSIKAALNPDELPYIYFVLKNDGTHHFSKTLKEHNQAINRYRKVR